ncbi:MAG: hypothetical protein DDT19_00764 [Syntrophomonadaceae bacterium]|nr:hypothetical protein [Bacillota bacterium]
MKTKLIGTTGGPICPVCNSKNMLTKRSGESWCRRCGWSGKIINIKTNNN